MPRTKSPKSKHRTSKMSKPLAGGLAALAGVGLMTPSLLAQVQPLLVIEKADISSWAPSEKDAALARALNMVPARLNELPGEIPDFPDEARPVIDMILTLIAREGRMSITYNHDDTSQLMGYGVTFSVDTKTAEDARSMHRTLMGLLEMSDAPFPIDPSERFEGMSQIATPAGQVHFGPSNAGGGWGYVMQFGAVDDPSDGFDALPASPDGVTSIVRAHMDFAALNPLAQMGRQMAEGFMGDSPELDMAFSSMEESGLIGERTIKIDYNAGYTDEYSVERFSMVDSRHAAEALGLPIEPLRRDELRAIPGDAVMASAARFDFNQFNEALDMMGEFGLPIEDGLAQFREQTGIDVRTDVFGAMGDAVAAYTSDSTGGGSLLSGVVLLGVGDRDRLAGTLAKLAGLANQAAQMNEHAARYVSVASWNHGGQDLMSLRFNGIPIPLELSLALTDDWLILGATPQSVIAAANQADGHGDGGLATNEAFTEQLDGGRRYVSLNYLDAQRLGRSGYPFACLLGSAVANGVRSPGLRDPGLVVPPFHELMDGARASVGGSYWEGEDYITEWRGDRSMLVQTSVMGGAIGQFAPLIAAFTIPAIANSRQFSLGDLRPTALARMLRAGVSIDPLDRAVIATMAAQAQPKALERLKGGLE